MKKINKDVFLTGFSKYYNHPVTRQIGKLKVNEGLSVNFNEWEECMIPQEFVRQYGIKNGKKFRTRMDKNSKIWLFLRVK